MAVKTIITGAGHPILRARAKRIAAFGKETEKLVQDLLDTVTAAKGAGLAAPQIGVSQSVCIAKIGEIFVPLLNPEILWRDTSEVPGEEGCLSLPDVWLFVPRAAAIIVRYLDEKKHEQEKKLMGFDARIVQHEVDHLLGKLIVDYPATSAPEPGEAL